MLFCSFLTPAPTSGRMTLKLIVRKRWGWAGWPAARAVSEKRATQCCRPVGKAMINDHVNEEGGERESNK
jgi:hypothetical protein